MRWPWQREPAPAAARAATSRPVGGWQDVPPPSRQFGDMPLITRPGSFTHELPAWQSPSFVQRMTHLVSPDAPSGLVDGDGGGLASPALRPAGSVALPAALPLVATRLSARVQRSAGAAGPDATATPLTTSTVDAPVLQLAAAPPSAQPHHEASSDEQDLPPTAALLGADADGDPVEPSAVPAPRADADRPPPAGPVAPAADRPLVARSAGAETPASSAALLGDPAPHGATYVTLPGPAAPVDGRDAPDAAVQRKPGVDVTPQDPRGPRPRVGLGAPLPHVPAAHPAPPPPAAHPPTAAAAVQRTTGAQAPPPGSGPRTTPAATAAGPDVADVERPVLGARPAPSGPPVDPPAATSPPDAAPTVGRLALPEPHRHEPVPQQPGADETPALSALSPAHGAAGDAAAVQRSETTDPAVAGTDDESNPPVQRVAPDAPIPPYRPALALPTHAPAHPPAGEPGGARHGSGGAPAGSRAAVQRSAMPSSAGRVVDAPLLGAAPRAFVQRAHHTGGEVAGAPVASRAPSAPTSAAVGGARTPGARPALDLQRSAPPAPREVDGPGLTTLRTGVVTADLPLSQAAAAVQRATAHDSGSAGPQARAISDADAAIAAPAAPAARTVQREAAAEPAGQPPAPSHPAPPPGRPAPPGPVGPIAAQDMRPDQLDELARRLYPPLARQLRADMLIDRERRGRRTDLR